MQSRRIAPLAALVVVAALALPSAALAQSPFTPLPQGATPTVSQPTTTSSTSSGGGLKGWQEALIFIAGIVLLGGIAYAIVADARERAPARAREDAETDADRAHRRQRAKERARDRGKAARAQRKRNRAR
jgi:hypothetical protein